MFPVGIVEKLVQHRQGDEEAFAGCDVVCSLKPKRTQLLTGCMEVEGDQIQDQQQIQQLRSRLYPDGIHIELPKSTSKARRSAARVAQSQLQENMDSPGR